MNVAGKAGEILRQVRIKKTNTSEPLMTCRKTLSDVETGIEILSRESGGGVPIYGSTGVRHEGGVILIQAWVRNVGTCRADAKGEAQAGSPRKRPSTDAGHRVGVARRTAYRDERGVAIDLLYRYSGIKQREIGERLGGIDYSAVSREHTRLRERLKTDRGLERSLRAIETIFDQM